LADFRAKYGLDEMTAEDFFIRFGPSSIELDLPMAAKHHAPSFRDLIKDRGSIKVGTFLPGPPHATCGRFEEEARGRQEMV
jgi:hypothetical protein